MVSSLKTLIEPDKKPLYPRAIIAASKSGQRKIKSFVALLEELAKKFNWEEARPVGVGRALFIQAD
jgi:hypothetical protein